VILKSVDEVEAVLLDVERRPHRRLEDAGPVVDGPHRIAGVDLVRRQVVPDVLLIVKEIDI